jgi:CHRD domain
MPIPRMIAGLLLGLAAVPAQAEKLAFHATLDGRHAETGSAATGRAKVKVDTKRHRLSVDLVLHGITREALWDKLVEAPIGPIHFHKYATAGGGGDSVLVLPLPYGPSYKPTTDGLRVILRGYDYEAGAKLLKSDLTFDQFVAALRSGLVVLNVHTDKFNPGEISGVVTEG